MTQTDAGANRIKYRFRQIPLRSTKNRQILLLLQLLLVLLLLIQQYPSKKKELVFAEKMDHPLLDDIPNFKYLTIIQKFGKKVFFKLCELIFFKGRSKTIRQFFEQEYRVSFPKDIVTYYDDEEDLIVETINNSISKKIEELDSEHDFLVMSNIFQFLWDNGVEKPEERGLKEAMEKLIHEIKFVKTDQYFSKKFTNAVLSDKLEQFQTFIERTTQDAKRSMTHSDINFDILKEEMKTYIEFLLNIEIWDTYESSNPLDMVKLKHKLISYCEELKKNAKRRMVEEITKLRGIWFAQNRVNLYTSNPIVPWKLEYDNVFQNEIDEPKKKNGVGKGIIINHNQILDIRYPAVVIVTGDAGVGKTTMLLDIVKKFDDMQSNTLSTLVDSSSFTEKLCKDRKMISKETQPNNLDKFDEDDDDDDDDTVEMLYLSSFEILFFISMRNGKFDEFDDYLKGLLPQTLEKESPYSLECVWGTIAQSKCLILCDGYDEANDKSKKLFEQLLCFGSQQNFRFIVTTRPSETPKLVNAIDYAHHDRIILNVLPLQPRDMKILVEKIIIHDYQAKKNDDNCNIDKDVVKAELMKVIDGMEDGGGGGVELLDVLRNPLYFNRFVFLYITNPELRRLMKSVLNPPYTYSSISIMNLYLQLDAYKRQTIVERIGIESAALKEFDDAYLDFSVRQNSKKDNGKKYQLSKKDLKMIKSKVRNENVRNNFNHIISSYFNTKCVSKLYIETVYSYRYKNELEFVAAQDICNTIMRNHDDVSTNIFERAVISSVFFDRFCKRNKEH